MNLIKDFTKWSYLLLILLTVSCKRKQALVTEKKYTHPCGCVLSEEEMIMKCPIDAIGDSVTVCKVGTNNVIGSNRGPMTWQQYIESEYFGGEGLVVDCKTGKTIFHDLNSPVISYKNKVLIADNRTRIDVFDKRKNRWLNLELPDWRQTVYAVNGELRTTSDSLIFKPPFQEKQAFAAVDSEYIAEQKRSDHYLISRTAIRLMVCAMNGDKVSEERLLSLEKDFAAYYNEHADSKKYLDQYLRLYKAYKDHIGKTGKREYYDLSIFPYFKDSAKIK